MEPAPEPKPPPETENERVRPPVVLISVFVIAICGLIYELIAGTLASYLLGDSVFQFSTVIGAYLSAMGLGAWLSRMIDRRLVARFIEIELAVALLGGFSAAILFLAFPRLSFFRPLLYGLVLAIGTLVGLEIPLLIRILEDRFDLKELVARVLTVDYAGALVASLAFPIFIVPKLGLVRGAFLVGCLNAAVAVWLCYSFSEAPGPGPGVRLRWLKAEGWLCLLLLLVGVAFSDRLTSWAEDDLYPDPIVFARSSSHQRLIVTKGRAGFQLYLNGNLQFSSADEHRYHEALVHPAFSVLEDREHLPPKVVLILGGGDGLAAREILKHEGVQKIVLVDLDPAMTELGRTFPLLAAQNRGSLSDPRVTLVHEDAFVWLERRPEGEERFSAIIVDFPDPNSFSLGKLYTTRFYRQLKRALDPEGMVAIQATSPLLARRSYWCVVATVEAAGYFVRPYHASVPSFGEWGYLLASPRPFDLPERLDGISLAFLTPEVMLGMFEFARDMAKVPAEVNRLNNQILVQYYQEEWSVWE